MTLSRRTISKNPINHLESEDKYTAFCGLAKTRASMIFASKQLSLVPKTQFLYFRKTKISKMKASSFPTRPVFCKCIGKTYWETSRLPPFPICNGGRTEYYISYTCTKRKFSFVSFPPSSHITIHVQ